MSEYISREETLKAIQPRYAPAINKVLAGIIESVPAADVKPVVRGKWEHSRFYPVYQERCSVCEEWSSDYANFCPYCGADMRGSE